MTTNNCPHCNTPNRSSARFCSNCGEPLLQGVPENSRPDLDQPALDPEIILHERYRIENELGRGGFGAVYRAWDLSLNRPCAVKENLDTSPEAQRQFAREATILANLTHPNLPRVTDHFTVEGQGQYLVMDFVDGEDLASRMQREGTAPVGQSLEWVTQVADALTYLHSRKPSVVHRDIKPANIRITPEGKAMLVDFGLVKVYDPNLQTTMGARAVTPGYAPPEQYGQGNTDARSDIYALGATLFKLLTGEEPLESVQRMAGKKMPPAHQLNANISPHISESIERAMNLEPEGRFQDAMDFKTALSSPSSTVMVSPGRPVPQSTVRAAAEAPSIPRPIPQAAAPTKKRGRNWLLWGGIIAVVVLCLGTFMAIGAYMIGEQNDAANKTKTSDAIHLQETLQERVKRTSTAKAQAVIDVQMQATETAAAQNVTATARAEATAKAGTAATATAQVQSTLEARASYVSSLEAQGELIYGPIDGSLEHNREDGLVADTSAEVEVQNFIVEATFFNPHATSLSPWNYGFMFRHSEKNNQYRFIIESSKEWVLKNHIDDPDGENINEGFLADLDTSEGGSNTIKIIADGNRGLFYLNGVFISELDLSTRTNAGDITIATGFYKEDEVDGEFTGYSGFTVWALP